MKYIIIISSFALVFFSCKKDSNPVASWNPQVQKVSVSFSGSAKYADIWYAYDYPLANGKDSLINKWIYNESLPWSVNINERQGNYFDCQSQWNKMDNTGFLKISVSINGVLYADSQANNPNACVTLDVKIP
jgi:hypothetical protein